MTLRLLAVAIVLVVANAVFAQTDATDAPTMMLGFLKPGMHLGVTSVEGTTSVILHTYTADDYKIAQDLKSQLGTSLNSASTIAETNASVRAKFQDYISKLNLSDDSRERIMIMAPVRTSFGTVVAVGDDYLLLNPDGEQNSKRIIPKASIGTIYLDANPVRFIDLGSRSQSGRDE